MVASSVILIIHLLGVRQQVPVRCLQPTMRGIAEMFLRYAIHQYLLYLRKYLLDLIYMYPFYNSALATTLQFIGAPVETEEVKPSVPDWLIVPLDNVIVEGVARFDTL